MRFADAVTLAWIPISLVLFALLPPRRAVLAAYLGAWLFLPMKAGLVIPILPDIDKVTASSLAVCLGVMLFDTPRLFTFRFRWFDLPMLWWCTTPFMSSITNGLGAWDGASAVIEQVALFGFPYFIGRIYFNDWEGFRDLAIGIFLGGVIYIPLCLFEIRFSPQLHKMIYGYYQHSFAQTIRAGGFRPMVFMQHGLAVGFWMTAASLMGVWLMVSGSLKQIWGIPMIVIVPILIVTTILCKSAAGVLFLFIGVAALFGVKWTRTALPIYCLVAIAPLYMFLRTTGIVDGTWLLETATEVWGPERAQSLETRIKSENALTANAMKKWKFGYGRWDPNSKNGPAWMPRNEETGKKMAIPDGMWVITMGVDGLSGVCALTLSILMPVLLLRTRVPPRWWAHPMAAPAAACAVLLTLHMADNLLNAMINPIFICCIGGLCVLGTQQRQPQPRGYAAQPQQPQRGMRRPMPMNARPSGMPVAGRV